MAVYAAVLSLSSTIDQIQQHPSPPISLNQQQLHSLTQNLSFLQNFLETHSTDEDEHLESRIAEAAYAAEDVIESHIIDQFEAGSTCHAENTSCVDFYQGLERVIKDMDLLKNEITNMGPQDHQLLSKISKLSIDSVRPVSRIQNNILVDFGDILNDVMDKLTGEQHNLEIIPIVGMGGMGYSPSDSDGVPTSWPPLWNLQTIDLREVPFAPADIWRMPHLRHVMCVDEFELPNPPCGKENFDLKSLQTLHFIKKFKCCEEVLKKIPCIKVLGLEYDEARVEEEGWHSFCLNNLARLQNLKSLKLRLFRNRNLVIMQNLSLPHSLEKLSLLHTYLLWEDFNTKVGSLPLLEFLYLDNIFCITPEWETKEGQFCSLKSLRLVNCDLECWTTDDTHFPRLEHLSLFGLSKLEEIPSCIGDIPTLKSIQVIDCLKSVGDSAKKIKEEQLSDYGNDLQIIVEWEAI